MGELGAGSVQGLFGRPAFGYVLQSADENRPVRDPFDPMTDDVHVSQRTTRRDDAKREIEIRALCGTSDRGLNRWDVLRMNGGLNQRHRHLNSGFESEDTVDF